ncbi:MAG: hypothetical protein KGJ06_02430 [Pseudomonadota bacterium]|nr:hypothetical protein [Pseudomonadota bacterium]
MSNPTFGDYDQMTPDQLRNEEKQLKGQLANNEAGFLARTGNIAIGTVIGAPVGLAAGAVTYGVKNRNVELELGEKIEEAFLNGKLKGGKLAIATGALVALGATLAATYKFWKDSSIKQGIEDSARLSHVERLLAEKQAPGNDVSKTDSPSR